MTGIQSMLLKLTDITKDYFSPDEKNITSVLKGINLEINKGQTIAITGPSGSGKSTLLNIAGTLDQPTSGKIIFNNRNLETMPVKKISQFRNQHIGFIFQMHYLLPQCTALENVLIPSLPNMNKNNRQSYLEKANKLLDKVGMANHKNKKSTLLSGGECQRIAVIRALINSPDIILADEPTGSLDKRNSKNLVHLLLELNKEEQTALILVTHSDETAAHMEKHYSLQEGVLVQN